jgi:hypothetical protein
MIKIFLGVALLSFKPDRAQALDPELIVICYSLLEFDYFFIL